MSAQEAHQKKETQLVVFVLRGEEFGVEISQVREIVRMMEITRIPEAPGFIEGVVNLRGQVIAVIDLAKQFDLGSIAELPKTARIVVAEVGDKTVGMIVDEVPEVLRISKDEIKDTPELIKSRVNAGYVQGVAKLGERLIVMLDISKVLSERQVKELEGVE